MLDALGSSLGSHGSSPKRSSSRESSKHQTSSIEKTLRGDYSGSGKGCGKTCFLSLGRVFERIEGNLAKVDQREGAEFYTLEGTFHAGMYWRREREGESSRHKGDSSLRFRREASAES